MRKASRKDRIERLRRSLKDRVLCLDGATGTWLQGCDLTDDDFGGAELAGCNEHLVITRPDVVRDMHTGYLEAGADVVETNTFGGTPLVLDEYGLGAQAPEHNRLAAQIAREAADALSTEDKPRFVAGSMGPTTRSLTVTGGIDFDEMSRHYEVQARALYEGGADYFLVETCIDTRNIKAALLAIERVNREVEVPLPVAVSATIEATGTMLAGQRAEALYTSLDHLDLLYIGLNCATGPEFMTDHIRSLAELARCPVACVPNAGLPDEEGRFLETAESMSAVLGRFGERGWLNVIGGCCGTTVEHIRAFSELAARMTPRVPTQARRIAVSGVDFVELDPSNRPLIVGERTNVIGSRKFKRLVVQDKLDEAAEIARAQVRGGAQVIDVCMANPDRDEMQDMEAFLERAIKMVKVPLMIDSTDAAVIERALSYCQGKAIINSINLEDGEERFEQVVPLARSFGAALVVGCIDEDPEQGMGVTRERKLEIATRSYEILTEKYGVAPEDIWFDPLVFPCATGDAQYVGSAVETIEGVRLIKERFPRCATVLGISNVSFGLPAAGREVLNAIFLYHCTKAGLDMAIVNSEKLERYAQIPEEERRLGEDLLWNRGEDPVAAFSDAFRDRKPIVVDRSTMPLDERLSAYIIQGTRDGLIADLDEALAEGRPPLQIINGPLMAGMDEVGRLFNANELIVAEVLQSAESMKAGVAHLEQFMEKHEQSSRGKLLLATVKGDVHDIGKNLVDIIFSNNGFEVVNLGIKVPPEQLVAAVREHSPDLIGLSGLLVKSAQQMVITADDLSEAGVRQPILVGGAALSQNFVDRKIAPAYAGDVEYASDAMSGLELARRFMDPEARQALLEAMQQRREAAPAPAAAAPSATPVIRSGRSAEVPVLESPPAPPDFDRHVLRNTPIDQIWSYVNPMVLYGRHLGLKGKHVRLLDTPEQRTLNGDPKARKALELQATVAAIKDRYRNSPQMAPRAVYQFFRAESEGNQLHLLDASGTRLQSFDFPRQQRNPGLCIADYTNPAGAAPDSVCLFVTSVGEGVARSCQELKDAGQYVESHVLAALALESAEAYAEWVHGRIRSAWGFPDPPEMTMLQRFAARYQGKRYSFGYPACPRLDDQRQLFDLLQPSDIGVELTEEMMMAPEASVSALVFHHPRAQYFSAEAEEAELASSGASAAPAG